MTGELKSDRLKVVSISISSSAGKLEDNVGGATDYENLVSIYMTRKCVIYSKGRIDKINVCSFLIVPRGCVKTKLHILKE